MAALAYAAGVALARSPAGIMSSYRGGSTLAATLDLAAGFALIVAGLASLRERRTSVLGPLAIAAGVAWFAADWEGWEGGPDVVRVFGMAIAPFTLALVAHLVIASAPAVRASRRAAVLSLYGAMAVIGVGGALVRDPYLDVNCWRTCHANPLLIHADPGLAAALGTAEWVCWIVAGAGLAGMCCVRLVRTRGPARRLRWRVQAAGVLIGGVWAVSGFVLLLGPAENPNVPADMAAFLARAAACILLAVTLGLTAYAAHRRRLDVARLAVALPPGGVRRVLADALADPDLQIAYRVGDSARYVAASGEDIAVVASTERLATPILRGGREVARVIHDASSLSLAELEGELGAAARLALENEALSAEALAQMHDLRASRQRIVQSGDAERGRLERDLHDGAQQRLLALGYDLRVACAAAGERHELRALLARAGDEAQRSLELLRELAHGIYPAILAEAGLGAALSSFADGAPIPVELDVRIDARPWAAAETAAYLAVLDAVDTAARAGATFARVRVTQSRGELTVEVAVDAELPRDTRSSIADRIGALDGSLDWQAQSVRAVIPCG
jgi:signal transduction histidine kinase